jgi:hypothetical protein
VPVSISDRRARRAKGARTYGGIRGCSPRSSQKSSHSLGKSTISNTYIFFQSAFQSAFPEARTRSVRIFLESGNPLILLTYSLSMLLGLNSYFRGSHRMVFLFSRMPPSVRPLPAGRRAIARVLARRLEGLSARLASQALESALGACGAAIAALGIMRPDCIVDTCSRYP